MSKDVMLCAAVRLSVFKDGLRQRVLKCLTAAMAANPVLAFAGADIAGMGDSAAVGATSLRKSALTIAQFAGVIFVIGGLVAAKNKKDNPQIKIGAIIASILFGVCLVVVPEIIKRSQAQVGLAPVDVG
ncbi:TraR protein [Pseudomonas savastanoi]|uniref:TraR protein n=1 Tax=Pseudomonas savastanoi TaxID=29438 RepID=A0A3M5AWX3_PSESS|nr:TraR protein [Pseudomonas savastanoi]